MLCQGLLAIDLLALAADMGDAKHYVRWYILVLGRAKAEIVPNHHYPLLLPQHYFAKDCLV